LTKKALAEAVVAVVAVSAVAAVVRVEPSGALLPPDVIESSATGRDFLSAREGLFIIDAAAS
jgi:hypothetical protein